MSNETVLGLILAISALLTGVTIKTGAYLATRDDKDKKENKDKE